MRKERFGGGGGSRTRVRERPLYDDYVRICFVFLSRELKNQQDAHDPARLFSAFRSEQKPGPIPPYDAIRSPCEPKDRGGYLKIKQRKQTACCWQLLFSDRFTGAQNPARLHTMTRTRRLVRSSSKLVVQYAPMHPCGLPDHVMHQPPLDPSQSLRSASVPAAPMILCSSSIHSTLRANLFPDVRDLSCRLSLPTLF